MSVDPHHDRRGNVTEMHYGKYGQNRDVETSSASPKSFCRISALSKLPNEAGIWALTTEMNV